MTSDVRAAVALLRDKGAKRVAIVGAELGANLAVNAAAEDPDIASIVLLSPGLDYKGVVSNDAMKRYGPRPVLFVASNDDSYGARSATVLDGFAKGVHQLQLFEAAGKGARMFNHEPMLEGQVLGFVNANWVAAAPTAQTTKDVDIKVESEGPKATGPETYTVPGSPPSPK
jgi:acetyl esterase/lipase